jgi:hypothetical protein
MTQRWLDRRPRTTRRNLIWLLLAFISGSVAADEVRAAVAMPRGFEALRLGMTESELRELRPGAEPFDLFGEPEQKSDDSLNLYIESLTEDPFFDTVDFTFVRDRLCVVKWMLIGQPRDFAARRARLLQGAMQKWGGDFERVVLDWGYDASEEEDTRQVDLEKLLPGVRWARGAVEILIDYTPSESTRPGANDRATTQLPKLFRLSIYERSCLSPGFETSMKAMRPVPDDLSPGFFGDLRAEAAGVLFE